MFLFGNSDQGFSAGKLHLRIAIILINGEWLELLHHGHHIRFLGAAIANILNITKSLENTNKYMSKAL